MNQGGKIDIIWSSSTNRIPFSVVYIIFGTSFNTTEEIVGREFSLIRSRLAFQRYFIVNNICSTNIQ